MDHNPKAFFLFSPEAHYQNAMALYSSLKSYGYRPDLQVETAIRDVAQSLYAQKFNILRKPGIWYLIDELRLLTF